MSTVLIPFTAFSTVCPLHTLQPTSLHTVNLLSELTQEIYSVNLLSEITESISLADLLCELTQEIYSVNLLRKFTL